MSKKCPNCGYPNPDNLTECFKCHEDISDMRFARDRARERRQREQAQARQRENTQRQRQEEIEQRAVFQEELNTDRENQTVQDYVYNENTEYFRNAYSSLSNCIKGIYIILVLCVLDIILGILNGCLSETNGDDTFIMIIGGIVGAIECGFLLTVFKWMQSNLISQQKTVLMLENIRGDRENSTPDLSVLQEINSHLLNIENYYSNYTEESIREQSEQVSETSE